MNADTEVTDYKIFGYEYHNPDKMIEIYIAYNMSHPTIKSSFNAYCEFDKELELYELSTLDNTYILSMMLEEGLITIINDKYYFKKSSLLKLI